MNVDKMKPNSQTVLILNYLGMRHRSNNSWTTTKQIAKFFSHIFYRGNRSRLNDAQTALNRMLDAGFVTKSVINNIPHYAITSYGSSVPHLIRQRINSNPSLKRKYQAND